MGILTNFLFVYSVITCCKMRPPVLLLCLVGLCLCNTALSLKICAFNVQSFGEAKVHNQKVMGILLKVLVFVLVAFNSTWTTIQHDILTQ